jgi:probable F420-dependent oxidoreductase
MKIGLQIPVFEDDGAGVRRFIVGAEEMGFDSLWTGDHFVLPGRTRSSYPYSWRFDPDLPELFPNKRFLEAVVTCGFIGGATKRIEIGVGIFVLPMRNPVQFAKELVTLDVLTQGRLIAGMGAGWLREEFDAMGIPFEERGPRTDEYLAVLRALWSAEQPVSFHGRFFNFADVHCEPLPYTRGGPLIWMGGQTTIALKRCAKWASGWHAIELTPQEFAEHNQRLNEHLAAEGRAPGDVQRSIARRLKLSGDSLSETADLLAQYREAGCDHMIVYATPGRSADENMERARRLREEVMPLVS